MLNLAKGGTQERATLYKLNGFFLLLIYLFLFDQF